MFGGGAGGCGGGGLGGGAGAQRQRTIAWLSAGGGAVHETLLGVLDQ